MKKNIVCSFFCMLLCMLAGFSVYWRKTVLVEFDADTERSAHVRPAYTQTKEAVLQPMTPVRTIKPFGQHVTFNLPVENLSSFRLYFSVGKGQEIKINSLKFIGEKSVVFSLDPEDVVTRELPELTVEDLDIEGKYRLSLTAAVLSAVFFWGMFYLIFSFRTASLLAAAAAGYFCFGFYLNKSLSAMNSCFAVFVVASLYLLYREVFIVSKTVFNKPLFVFGAVFSLLHLLAYSMEYSASFEVIKYNLLQAALSIVGETLLCYAAALCVFKGFDRLGESEGLSGNGAAGYFGKHIFLCPFLLILSVWLVLDLIYYPGKISWDMVNQIRQYRNLFFRSQHHPCFASFLMWMCVEAGMILSSQRLGVFLYILLQNVVCAAAFAACFPYFKKQGLSFSFMIGSLLFFAAVPFGLFAVFGAKDILYSGFFVLFVLQTVSFKNDKSPLRPVLYAGTALLLSLLRNNGIYVVLPTFLFLFFRTDRKKETAAMFFGVSGVFFVLTSVVFPSLGFPQGSKREMLSIPFQQTAAYIKKHGSELTPEEYEKINTAITVSGLAEAYDRGCSDPVKRKYRLNKKENELSGLAGYFAVWAKMFFKHPVTYIYAFLDQTSRYYSFLPVPIKIPSRLVLLKKFPAYQSSEVTERLRYATDKFFYDYLSFFPLFYILYSCPFYTASVLLAFIYVLQKRKKKDKAFFVPLLLSLAVCVASPVNGLLRYMIPVIAAAPLFVGCSVSAKGDKAEST